MSPTQRTLKLMRERGWIAEVTERWIPGGGGRPGIRKDLWSFCDVLCIHPDTGEILAVQTTSASNASARVKKIAECELTPIVRKCGIGIHVHGWVKPSKSNRRWTVRERDLS
jgi:hypothetical protein